LDDARLPGIAEVEGAFTSAGLQPGEHQVIRQQIDVSLAAHLERLRLRAISTLALLSDAEFQSGIHSVGARFCRAAVRRSPSSCSW
jgi:hypothetical protein